MTILQEPPYEVEKKISTLRGLFAHCESAEMRYHRLIELGRSLPPYPRALQIPSLQIAGCQSILYLSSRLEEGKLFFEAGSDALISLGLAAILIHVYSGESPQTILETPPTFLAELGILGALTPSRSNGLAYLHLRIKRDALLHSKAQLLLTDVPARGS